MQRKPCPICQKDTISNPRYPGAVCRECYEKTTDINGRKVQFTNTSMSGGCKGIYTDTGEDYNSDVCYIMKVRCLAGEERFGGIVIVKE